MAFKRELIVAVIFLNFKKWRYFQSLIENGRGKSSQIRWREKHCYLNQSTKCPQFFQLNGTNNYLEKHIFQCVCEKSGRFLTKILTNHKIIVLFVEILVANWKIFLTLISTNLYFLFDHTKIFGSKFVFCELVKVRCYSF